MEVLHLSEAEAYLRIWAARASRKHPMLLTMLADGRIHLTAIGKLARHLTRENRDELLERATYRSKRQILELVAEIAPRPDVPPLMRKLPQRRTLPTPDFLVVPSRGEDPLPELGRDAKRELRPDGVAAPEPGVLQEQLGPDGAIAPQRGARLDEAVCKHDVSHGHAYADGSAVPAPQAVFASSVPRSIVANPAQASVLPPPVVQPLSPGRYKVQFTASAELHDKLERLRALMSAGAPDADLVSVIELAVTEKLERLEARRFAQTRAPRKGLAETKAETETGPELASRAISPRPSGGPSVSVTKADAAIRTRGVSDVRSATGSNTTTGVHLALAATTAWPTSGCCVAPTTPTSQSATTAKRPWTAIGVAMSKLPWRRPDPEKRVKDQACLAAVQGEARPGVAEGRLH